MPSSLLKFVVDNSTVKIGGRKYKVVQIGNQMWMAENLDYKFDYNGSTLPVGSSGAPTTPAAWYYNNSESDYGIDGTYKCGLLYNWYAAKYLDDNKTTLLPSGWHVPTLTEYNTLATECGGASVAGAKLKSLDNSINSNWPTRWNGTDAYGFSALPSGCYSNPPSGVIRFTEINECFNVWTLTEFDSENARLTWIDINSIFELNYKQRDKFNAYSLRLVKTLS